MKIVKLLITQPQGKQIDYFYIGSQVNTIKTFFIPKEALTSSNFKPVLGMFMSSYRTITKMNIILNDDPYSKDALNTIKQINETVAILLSYNNSGTWRYLCYTYAFLNSTFARMGDSCNYWSDSSLLYTSSNLSSGNDCHSK
ncbi:hypothetical protein [Clostridium sp.]|uniref:hypothetical protein n=1 Tax=Clostridium sp. TaxID=1506 RepID=UPI002635C970|nr:hypothetical protein [uncultured Clostridium sp.]